MSTTPMPPSPTEAAKQATATPVSRKERRRARAALKNAKRGENARRKRLGSPLFPRKVLPTESYPGALVLRAARSAQDALGYEALREDGIIYIGNDQYSRVIEFGDLSFQTVRQSEQDHIHEMYRSALNEFDPSTKVQIKLVCRVVDRDEFLSSMKLDLVEGDERGNVYRREWNEIIEKKVTDTRQNVVRRRLMVLTVTEESLERAQTSLAHAVEVALRNLQDMGVPDIHTLSGDDLLEVVDSITNPSDGRGLVSFADLKVQDDRGRGAVQLGYTTKDLVAPPDITRLDPTHISWGEQVGQALYVQKWGRSIRSDMLAMLTELPVNQVITIDVRPWDPNDAIELVESVGTDLTAQKSNYIRDHSQQMFVTDEMLPAPLNDALSNVQSLRGDILDADEAMFTVGISILTWAESVEECDEAAKQISERVRRFSYRISPLKNLQGQGFAAALPTGRFDIPYSRTMTSSPLACLIPFISVEIFDPNGMYMGQDRTSKNFVCYDRTTAIAPNGLILGMPGRGKSVAAKLQILWTKLKYHDAPTYIVDPEGEYGAVVEEVNGLEVTVGAGSCAHFNPLDIVLEDSESAALELKSDMIISAVEMMSGEITSKQKSLVDRCVGVIYERYLQTRDPQDMPILSDLYEALRAQPEEEAHDLATTIERFVVGQAATFNHRTNVDLANPLISFNIRDNGTNMRPVAELFVLEFIWQRAVQNRSLGLRTWIFIDEFHLLLNNPSSAAYFVSLWARARKYGAIPTAITQNVSTFGDPDRPELMTIFKNTDLFILLGQAPEDAKLLASALGLSGDHVNYLTKANEGCGIILASTRLVEFENRLPEGRILSLLNTKPGA